MPGDQGDALLRELHASLEALNTLATHREHLGEDLAVAIESTVADARRRLARERLVIAVVGARGSGRTTFINALLGERVLPAARPAQATILVRSGASEGYRARLTGGETEDFDVLQPDRAAELGERLRAAEQALSSARDEREHAARELEAATRAADSAQRTLTGVFQSFEVARAEAERVGRELAQIEAEEDRLVREADEQARALPALLVARPPLWAAWLWILRVVLAFWHRAAFRLHRDTARKLRTVRTQAGRLRRSASEAAGECLRAEGRLTTAAAPTEATGTEFARARARLLELDQRVAELARAAEQARAELDGARAARRRRFLERVAALCDPGRRLEEIEVVFPARFLAADVSLLDTPGLTATDEAARKQAWDIVRERADGCMLVSELDQNISGATRDLLILLREIVPHMVLVLTKADDFVARAFRDGEPEPWSEMDEARRIGTRRFAREVGRDPNTVLSVAVAAEPTLSPGAHAHFDERFKADADTLFELIRRERTLILGARTASEVRRCIRRTSDAEGRAERSYEAKIEELERSRRPEPDQFRSQQLQAAEPRIAACASEIERAQSQAIAGRIAELRAQAEQLIDNCSAQRVLEEALVELDASLTRDLARIPTETARETELKIEQSLRELEQTAFDALRRRYDLPPLVVRWTNPSIHIEAAPVWSDAPLGLSSAGGGLVRRFTRLRVGLLIGGALLGAAIGTAIAPLAGTLLGAAAGALLPAFKTFDGLKRELGRAVEQRLDRARSALLEQAREARQSAGEALSAAFARSLSRATIQYGKWIAAPLEVERAELERERALLAELVGLRQRLEQRDQGLARAMVAATQASFGLCTPKGARASRPPAE